DYVASAGSLSFPRGIAVRSFVVKLVNDTVYKPARSLDLALSAPSAGALGTSHATLTILDDDAPGTVQFSLGDVTVGAGAGSATIKILRSGRLAAGQTVTFTTADGSAIAGTHYQDASQTLRFAAFETSKQVTIQILDDGVGGGGAASVRLSLTSPAGGAAI